MEKFKKFLSTGRKYDPFFKIFKIVRLVFLFVLISTLQLTAGVFSETTNPVAQQQDGITVTGIVANSAGDPIPGVNVYEKSDPSHGVITSVEGTYSITFTNQDAILVFSFIGFVNQEVQVAGRSTINVTLIEQFQDLDEVVVTALGIKRQIKQLGYAMTEVDGAEIAAVNTVNPVQALQGKSAGVSIGQSDGGLFGNLKIQIRGVSTLNSNNNQPIFVIDGVIIDNPVSTASADWDANPNDYGSQLKNLNPDDYESVSILKGAAATALYGSRGINGAVVIKTKDGKAQKGLGVKVTQSFGIDHIYDQPAIQYEFGPGDIPPWSNPNGDQDKWDYRNILLNSDDIPTKIGANSWHYGPKYDGRDIEDYDGSIVKYLPNKNHMLDVYDQGWNSNTSVALTGGNDKGSFYLSNSYNYRKGNLPANEFSRYSLLLNSSYNLNDWLRADVSISFTTSTPKNPRNDLGDRFIYGTFQTWYDANKWKSRDVYQAPHGGRPKSGDKYEHVPGNNIWFAYNLNEQVRKEYVTRPIVRLTADLTNWMSVTAEGNMNVYTINYEKKNLGQGYANEGGSYEIKHNDDISRTGKLILNLNRKLTDDISSSLILGGEIWDQRKSWTRSWTDGGLIVPGKFFLENSKKTKKGDGKITGTKQINSFYFMANFGWRDQLFVDITGRNDWSSSLVYTDGTGNNSYFYPSVSTSWIFNETFNLPQWVTFGKARLSWAKVGNDTSPYAINKGYTVKNHELSSGNAYTNAKSTTLVDTDLKPEMKNSLEVGFDVRMFNNRLGVDFAWYDETIKNQIGEIPIPAESGYNKMFTNIGTMTNTGIELSLRGVPVKTSSFEWTTTFNYWNNKTMISDLREEVGEYKTLGGSISYGNLRVGSVAYEDGEYGVIMSDTKPLEWNNENDANDPRNGMKVLTWYDSYRGANLTRSYEVQEIGKVQPDFEGSWDNSFRWKDLTLSVLLDARFGGHIASFSSKYGTAWGLLEESLYGRSPEHGGVTWTSQYADSNGNEYTDGVIPEGVFKDGQMVTGPDGNQHDVGGMTFKEAHAAGHVEPVHAGWWNWRNSSWGGGVINDNWFAEVKYISIRNVSLGYNLPKSVAHKIKAQNVHFAVNARNLGYLYNSLPNNLNPESFRGTSSSDSFRMRALSPYTAYYTFTLSVDF